MSSNSNGILVVQTSSAPFEWRRDEIIQGFPWEIIGNLTNPLKGTPPESYDNLRMAFGKFWHSGSWKSAPRNQNTRFQFVNYVSGGLGGLAEHRGITVLGESNPVGGPTLMGRMNYQSFMNHVLNNITPNSQPKYGNFDMDDPYLYPNNQNAFIDALGGSGSPANGEPTVEHFRNLKPRKVEFIIAAAGDQNFKIDSFYQPEKDRFNLPDTPDYWYKAQEWQDFILRDINNKTFYDHPFRFKKNILSNVRSQSGPPNLTTNNIDIEPFYNFDIPAYEENIQDVSSSLLPNIYMFLAEGSYFEDTDNSMLKRHI